MSRLPRAMGGFWSGEDQMPPQRGEWISYDELWSAWDAFEDRGYRERFKWFADNSDNPSNHEDATALARPYGLMPGIFWSESERQQIPIFAVYARQAVGG